MAGQVNKINNYELAKVWKPFELTTNLNSTSTTSTYLPSETTSIGVGSTTGFPSSGELRIGDEILSYTSTTTTAFQNLTRGLYGTTAATIENADPVSQVYNSGLHELQGFTQVITKISCNVETKGLYQWYSDSIGNNIIRTLTPTSSAGYDFLSSVAFGPYVRYIISPTNTTTTSIYFTTEFSYQAVNPQLFTLNSGVFDSMISQLTRSVLVGQTSGGIFGNIQTAQNALKVAINDPLTAFGELKTSESYPLVQLSFVYGTNSRQTVQTTTGSGIITAANSLLSVSTSTTTGSTAILESKRPCKYRTGQGVNVKITGIFTTGVADTTQLLGIGDGSNGFFFGYNGATFGILHRKPGIDTWVNQTAWNIDTMSGTGVSGQTLDTTQGNVYTISFQWLGFGQIVFSIEDKTTGVIQPVHRIQYANSNTTPSLIQPSLPLSIRVNNNTTTSDIIVKTSSMAGFTEGKKVLLGPNFSAESTAITGVTTEQPILSIRVNPTINSINARIPVVLQELTAVGEGTGTNVVRFFVWLNNNPQTPNWTNVSTNNSVVSYDVTSTSFGGGGIKIGSYVIERNNSLIIDYIPKNIILYEGDILSVSCSSASSVDPNVALVWIEDDSG